MDDLAAFLLQYPDVMADIETTGLRPDRHSIIQVSLVPFNFVTGAVAPREQCFDMCMQPNPARDNLESTMQWWYTKNLEVFTSICGRMRPHMEVLPQLHAYLTLLKHAKIWALRPFDYQFIDSYLVDSGLGMPMKYWNFREVGTACDIMLHGIMDAKEVRPAKVPGIAHDGINDCLSQIQWLFNARHYGHFGPIHTKSVNPGGLQVSPPAG